VLLFTMIVLPLMQIFNICFGVGVNFLDMPIAVKNDEIDILQCQYFNASGCIFEKNNYQTMSCVVLNYLASQNYKLINVESRKAGEMQLEKSNYFAFLYFPKNYTNELIEYIDDRENYNRDSRIYAYLTKTNLLESVNVLLEKTLKACSNNQKSVGNTLKINTIYGKDVKSYQNSNTALAVAVIAFYFPAIYAATVMLSEKMNEIFSRSIYAGVSILELVTSMFILNTALHIFQSFFACFVAYVIFLNPILISKSLFVYLLSMLLLNCIGFFFGVLVAVVVPTILGGTYVITGATLSQFLLSGIIWPIEGQPYFLKVISELLPITLVGNMMSHIALKGWSLNNPSILMGTSIAIAYIVVLILSLVVLGKFKRDLWIIQK